MRATLILILIFITHLSFAQGGELTVEGNINTKSIRIGGNNEVSLFSVSAAFADGEDFLAIAPSIDGTTNFDFPNELKFFGNGLLSKEVADDNAQAFSIFNNTTQQTVFLIEGDGQAFAKGMRIKLPPFPDYVFATDYDLLPLAELEAFIQTHHRLPNMPSAAEVAKEGVDIGTLEVQQTEKIEELTLYIIELGKRVEALEQENARLRTAAERN